MQTMERNRGMRKAMWAALAAAVVTAAGTGMTYGQTKAAATKAAAEPKAAKVVPHSDTAFARELLRLGQSELLNTAATQAKGTPAELMFKSQAIAASWREIKADKEHPDRVATLPALGREYVTDLDGYLKANPEGIDGVWALEEAQIIFAEISERIINRMEYWSSSERDRKQLAPMATLADRLLTLAGDQLTAAMSAAERAHVFDETGYLRAYEANQQVAYYRAWAAYYLALSMDATDKQRGELLTRAVALLQEWAEGDESNNVKYQSLLLRGKAYGENGKTLEALADLTAAGDVKAPGWVQYQAHYQMVVAKMRSKDFPGAKDELTKFKAWIDSQPEAGRSEAKTSAEMLGYRVAWGEAGTLAAGKPRDEAQLAALKILTGIVERDPRFRELVYEQLAAGVAEGDDLSKLMPMQALAVAWSQWNAAQSLEEANPDRKKLLERASEAAKTVREGKATAATEMKEATLIRAACEEQLGNLLEAVKLDLEFAKAAGKSDKRYEDVLKAGVSSLQKLLQNNPGAGNSAEVRLLTSDMLALRMASAPGGDPRWAYALGMSLLEQGKLKEAREALLKVPPGDARYTDAQFQLVWAAKQEVEKLLAEKANPAEVAAASDRLKTACADVLKKWDTAPDDAKQRLREDVVRVLLVQVQAQVNTAKNEKDGQELLKSLAALEKTAPAHGVTLTPAAKGAILRYRIAAYQLTKEAEKAMEELKKLPPADAPAIITGMVANNIEEIDRVEKTDSARAKVLSKAVSDLLGTLLGMMPAEAEGEARDIAETRYAYRQLQAAMLTRAGMTKESMAAWEDLKKKRPSDLRNDLGEARAMFAASDYQACQKKFIELVPQLQPDDATTADAYWECWLRISECQLKLQKPKTDLQMKLRDLRNMNPEQFGGKKWKEEYKRIIIEYGL